LTQRRDLEKSMRRLSLAAKAKGTKHLGEKRRQRHREKLMLSTDRQCDAADFPHLAAQCA
jgi:hypothetical protein